MELDLSIHLSGKTVAPPSHLRK
ncbi:hypothetical protein RDI58_008090 [Solanum bulbocastanum]|uniref:Uncharacterized protein n=1 Tax=Solanum bulbocastanum TaxID=147425 RepID=A0AAN8YJH1_SOLBU